MQRWWKLLATALVLVGGLLAQGGDPAWAQRPFPQFTPAPESRSPFPFHHSGIAILKELSLIADRPLVRCASDRKWGSMAAMNEHDLVSVPDSEVAAMRALAMLLDRSTANEAQELDLYE